MNNSSETPSVQHRWIKEQEVSEMTGISLSTLRKHRSRQTGIRFSKIGRSVVYALKDVVDFMEAHRVEPRKVK